MANRSETPSAKKSKSEILSFGEWVYELFQDERGHVSIKPVIAFLGSLILCGALIASAFLKETMQINDSLVDAIMVITSIGMGADTVDKFSRKKSPSKYNYSNKTDDDDEWGVPIRNKNRNDIPREDDGI